MSRPAPPELAALDILDAALTSVIWALMAANPETESEDWVLEVPDPAVQACLADAISANAITLQNVMDRYRRYVVDRINRHKSVSETNLSF